MIKAFKKYWNLVLSWFDDDWHDVYLDSNMNHGQGPLTNDEENNKRVYERRGERWNDNQKYTKKQNR